MEIMYIEASINKSTTTNELILILNMLRLIIN